MILSRARTWRDDRNSYGVDMHVREECCAAGRGQWEKVGDVVGGPDAGDTVGVGAKWHAGQQWDFVFDVDFADNQAPKKLACNRGDNPYEVAERCAQMRLARVAVLQCTAFQELPGHAALPVLGRFLNQFQLLSAPG